MAATRLSVIVMVIAIVMVIIPEIALAIVVVGVVVIVIVVLIIALVVIIVMSIVPMHAIDTLIATAPSSRSSFLLVTYGYRHEGGGGLMFRRALCFEACFLEGGSNVP